MPIGVEGGLRHGSPSTVRRSPPGCFAFPAPASDGNVQLCRQVREYPNDREPGASHAGRVASRDGRQPPAFGKGSWLGIRHRRGSRTVPIRNLVCLASSAVSQTKPPAILKGHYREHIRRNPDAGAEQLRRGYRAAGNCNLNSLYTYFV